jgi:hypothetical protein
MMGADLRMMLRSEPGAGDGVHEPLRHRFLAPLACAVLLTALLLIGWPAASALAAPITVDTTSDAIDANGGVCAGLTIASLPGPGGTTSLREAICAANNTAGDDTITFASSTNGTATTLGSQLPDITTNIQIQGNGAGQTIVDGNHAVNMFSVLSGLVGFSDLTIRNADVGFGGNGGGIFNIGGTITVANSVLSGNKSHANGGGIFSQGSLTVTGSTFTGNSTRGAGGGILFTAGTLTVTSSTFDTNDAFAGGGIAIDASGGSTTITNTTFSHNTGSFGGGLFVASATNNVIHSTFKDNVANNSNRGGGVYAIGGELTFRATIFANSTNLNCVNNGGTVGSNGSNLLDDNSCPDNAITDFSQPGDRRNVANLNLAALANNGGPTQTFALPAGSAAIDAVQGSCTDDGTAGGTTIAVDQRGTGRPIDGDGDGNAVCDVGAFEAPQYGRLILSATSPVSESVGSAPVTVTRVNGSVGAVTAVITPSDVSATAPADYDNTQINVSFNDGESGVKQFGVPIVNDTIDEPDETFAVALNIYSGATLGSPSTATITIQDDDPTPTISIDDVTVTEGDSGTVNAVFTVTLSGQSAQAITVTAQTADATATAGTDYTATGPTVLTFPSRGALTQTFTVPVLVDNLNELNETFVVNLTNPTGGATIAKAQGVGTILDDDGAPALSIVDVSQNEGNAGTTTFTFNVVLLPASGQPVSVVAQTATAGSDYTATGPTTLTFAPGVTSQPFAVQVVGDTVPEADETFVVNLTNAVNAGIADAQAVGTIRNDDSLPSIRINDVSQNEGNAGTTSFAFTVSLNAASGQTVTVVAQAGSGPTGGANLATAGTDFTITSPTTLTFPPGVTSQPFAVPVIGDTDEEADETFVVNLSSPSGATITRAQGIGRIKHDDAAVSESGAKDNKDDNKPKETEEQRQQHQLTNRGNRDDVTVEGNVMEVHADEAPPYVIIANRDGLVQVILLHDAAKAANSIQVGQYLEGSGEKQNEQLFEASDVSLKKTR